MLKKIRFAVIGTSDIAPYHIKAIENNTKAELVYIYSRNIKRAEKFAKRYNLIPTRTYEEILKNKDVDAVDIVTEPERHAQLALEAIENHKHVLIEKPLDTDIALAKKVVEVASKYPTVTSIVSPKRFELEIKDMKKELDNKTIGKPYLAEVRLMWPRTSEYYNKGTGWRGKKGNVLINQAVHWLDIAVWFFGFPIKIKSLFLKVKGDISCYDTAICCLEFPDSLLFNLICSTAVKQSESDVFRIYGTKGILDYVDKKQQKLAKRYLNKVITFLKAQKTPLQCQIDSFIDSIIYKKPPQVSVLDGYNALKIVELCKEENGQISF